jgi:hypothetical protein
MSTAKSIARQIQRVVTALRTAGEIGAVAAHAGLSRVTLQAWADGRTAPRLRNLTSLAKGLELRARELEEEAGELTARANSFVGLAAEVRATAEDVE